jgi:hypothetical protein
MFLHGGWAHIGGNMLFLWIFGDNAAYAARGIAKIIPRPGLCRAGALGSGLHRLCLLEHAA